MKVSVLTNVSYCSNKPTNEFMQDIYYGIMNSSFVYYKQVFAIDKQLQGTARNSGGTPPKTGAARRKRGGGIFPDKDKCN